MDLLEDGIITRFGVPAKITIDNAKAFSSTDLSSFCLSMALCCPTLQTIIPKVMVLLNPTIRT
jgi:hypothetical protein